MQEKIDQLNKTIQTLTDRINELETLLNIETMPLTFREAIRNEVIKDVDTLSITTQTITVGAGGGDIIVPKNPDAILVVNYKGRNYKVPYIS